MIFKDFFSRVSALLRGDRAQTAARVAAETEIQILTQALDVIHEPWRRELLRRRIVELKAQEAAVKETVT